MRRLGTRLDLCARNNPAREAGTPEHDRVARAHDRVFFCRDRVSLAPCRDRVPCVATGSGGGGEGGWDGQGAHDKALLA